MLSVMEVSLREAVRALLTVLMTMLTIVLGISEDAVGGSGHVGSASGCGTGSGNSSIVTVTAWMVALVVILCQRYASGSADKISGPRFCGDTVVVLQPI